MMRFASPVSRLLVCASLALVLVACSPSSTLEQLNGTWDISLEKTVAKNPSLQGNSTLDSLTNKVAVKLLEGLSLSFNVKDKLVSGRLIGLSFSNEQFGVVQDTNKSCTILLLREKLTFTVQGNELVMDSGDKTLVFLRRKAT